LSYSASTGHPLKKSSATFSNSFVKRSLAEYWCRASIEIRPINLAFLGAHTPNFTPGVLPPQKRSLVGTVLLSCLLGTTQFVREKTVDTLASFNIDLS
jgi:hypothetical protein